ncbi:MAG: hypothetical protein HWD58_05745 [Bacteroidota bacterium]|nr:MAG: hypothetical protein HWD58_05745 [Bacteroidota bacterium]
MYGINYGGCELPSAQAPSAPIVSTARPNMRFSICDIPAKVWEYTWWPGTFVYDSTAGVTTAYVPSTTTFNVSTIGGNRCLVKDSVTITISTHDVKAAPMDTTICEGDSYQAFAFGSGNAPSANYTWYDVNWGCIGLSCTNCTNPYITPPSTAFNTYHCVRVDAYGCSDTVTIKVNVLPRPVVSILNGDSLRIKYLQEVNLIATGGYIYNWVPVWGIVIRMYRT